MSGPTTRTEGVGREVRIRPAGEGDAGAILAMIRELAAFERLSDQVVATEAGLRATLFGPRPAAEVLLAEVEPSGGEPCGSAPSAGPPSGGGGGAVGFVLFFTTYSTFLAKPGLYVEDLFVAPAWRSRGIGKRLLGAVAQRAVERGCGRLEWSVLDWNEDAIRFYRSLGARPLEEWTMYRLTGEALRRLGTV